MKIIKTEEWLIDEDLYNENTREKNLKYIKEHCFEDGLSEEEKDKCISELVLIPDIDIVEFMNHSNAKSAMVKSCLKGKAKSVLFFYDENGNKIDKRIDMVCAKCGRPYHISRNYNGMHKKTLLCKSCACHYTQILGAQEKFEATMIKKYGCRRPIQNKETKEKIKNTMMEKYGAPSPLESEIVQKKITSTMVERYGVENPFHSSIFQYKCKKHYINHSVKGDELMERLSHDLPFELMYGDNEKLFTFKNHWYRVDGYIEEKNFAIEFQGNYYHANPSMYGKDQVFDTWGVRKTAQEIWDKDKKRKEELESTYGVKICYIWEQEYDDFGYEYVLDKIKKELEI